MVQHIKITISGVVYDVSGFVENHPGGTSTLKTFNNRDATSVFYSLHHPASKAHKILKTLPVVDIKDSEPEPEIKVNSSSCSHADQYMSLYKKAVECMNDKERITQYFLKEYAILLGLINLTIQLIKTRYALSAFTWGLAMLHGGWLSHHIVHGQWFVGLELVTSTLVCGYSIGWWREKHNIHHHAHTNVVGKDNDIARSHIKFDEKIPGEDLAIMKYQHYTIWPSLLVLRLFWCFTSISYAFHESDMASLGMLALHYLFHYWLLITWANLSYGMAVLWYMLSSGFTGLLLGLVVIQSHNGEQVSLDQDDDHFEHTIATTRNLDSSVFNDFITGYLNYQIEHHLFPWLPSCFFADIQQDVKNLCAAKGLQYKCYGWTDSCKKLYYHLKKVAATSQ